MGPALKFKLQKFIRKVAKVGIYSLVITDGLVR